MPTPNKKEIHRLASENQISNVSCFSSKYAIFF